MAYEEDDDYAGPEVTCPECGEAEFLNPDSGLCIDCDLTLDEDGDQEECTECGDKRDVTDMNDDGICEECQEALGILGQDEEEGE